MSDVQKSWLLGCVLLHALVCSAQTPPSLVLFLPTEAEVKSALLSSPMMDMARSKRDAGSAKALGIDVGPAEFTLRGSAQRRQEMLTGTPLHESMVSIERPIRLWGKRGLDAELSKQTLAYADIEYSDAMHEGTRELMRLWFSHLKALVDQKNAQSNLELTQKMYRLTQIQFKNGEVSQLDHQLASAELNRVRAADAVAKAQVQTARAAFTQRYPNVALPSQVSLTLGPHERAPLEALSDSMEVMRQEFLEKNHELNMMRIDAKRLQLVAQRAQKDQMPDPTIGVFTARERSGTESISGLLFSMPIAGSSRTYHSKVAMAEAQAAADKVRLLEQQLAASFDAMWLQFQNKRSASDSLRLAWEGQAQAAEKSLKAYALGEGNLAQTLMISRFASESLSAAESMNLEALELLALIRLDLHQMWDFDE